jgi:hypothetical protein
MVLSRKLSDLYVTGKELVLDDGNGEPVTVYIRKISPLDTEEAYRAANAAKANSLVKKTDPEDLMFQIITERSEKFTKDEILDQLADMELEKRRLVIEAELEAEDRWSKEDYLQGLHDAWESGLKEKHFTEPDEETQRVFAEMQEFTFELEKRLERELEAIKKDLGGTSAQKLRDRFFDLQFERQAEIAWLTEFRKQELYYAVRDAEDHNVKAFESPKEIDSVSQRLIKELRDAYTELSVDALEGKD